MMISKPHFLLGKEFRYDYPVFESTPLETNFCQVVELHRTSSTFQAYGVEYRRWQLPILNAFSLTIHKVQGLSLPSVTLALNKIFFSEGQAYVGLSRATASERLFLTQLDFDAIKADPEAIAEYDRLRTVALQLEP